MSIFSRKWAWLPVLLAAGGSSAAVLAQSPIGAPSAPFVIVSDIDDTTKITDVLHKPDAVKNGLTGSHVFAGMPELYRELVKTSESRGLDSVPGAAAHKPLLFLSGGPVSLAKASLKLLVTKNGFPDADIILRPDKEWLQAARTGQPTVGDFKTRELRKIAPDYPVPFLLLGDDTEQDPAALSGFAAEHPGQAVRVYIHRVRQDPPGTKHGVVPLPPTVTPYSTAFDIALLELHDGRLTPAQALRIGRAVAFAIQTGLGAEVFPSYVYCPENDTYPKDSSPRADPSLEALKPVLAAEIRGYCLQREGHVGHTPPKPADAANDPGP